MNYRQLSSLTLFSCTVFLLTGCYQDQQQDHVVRFGATSVYKLMDGAREQTPDKNATQFYEQRFNFHPRFNQPLHRIVAGQGAETVYLGIVAPPVPNNLGVLIQSDSVWSLLHEKKLTEKARLALLKNRRGEYDVRYIGESSKTNNTHVINLLTKDSVTARSYYDADNLFKGNLLL